MRGLHTGLYDVISNDAVIAPMSGVGCPMSLFLPSV